MTREPRTSPIVPSYGESSLADLSASILASLTGDTAGNVLGLPESGRACLLIIDGLGWELLRAHQAAAPFLSELAFNSRPLTAGFPSTTATSLGTLGTALPPGEHGMLGYQVAGARQRAACSTPCAGATTSTRSPGSRSGRCTSGRPTRASPPSTSRPAPSRTAGLTRATLRGARYRPANSLGALAAETVGRPA